MVSGPGNMFPGAITKRSVESKNEHKQLSVPPGLNAVQRQRANPSRCCFVSSFQNIQIGRTTGHNVRSEILSGIAQNLAWHNTEQILPVLRNQEQYRDFIGTFNLKQIFCTPDENQLICQWMFPSRVLRMSALLNRFDINDSAKSSSECTKLHCIPVGYYRSTEQFTGIMSASIAETDMLPDCHVTPVLYTAIVNEQAFLLNTVAVLDPLDSKSFDPFMSGSRPKIFHIGKKWVWSCVWSPGLHNNFAVGTEKQAYIFDANIGKKFSLNTQRSDVLSQAFTSPVSFGSVLALESDFSLAECYVL